LGGIATPIAGVPRAVSNDGSLIVMNYTNELNEVCAYRLTTLNGVEGLGWVEVGVGSSGLAMSGDGSVIVGTSRHERAFIWDAVRGLRDLKVELETEHGLHLDGWNLIAANGISAEGTVIAGTGINPEGNVEAWMVRLTVPKPELRIERIDSTVIIRWPANFDRFVLQAAATLDANSVWTPVMTEPTLVNGEFVIPMPIAGQAQYYRLFKP
jgi:hypothetical protein